MLEFLGRGRWGVDIITIGSDLTGSNERKRSMARFSDLNDDILLAIVALLEAIELVHWGMCSRRLYQSTNSVKLWKEIAVSLEKSSIILPFYFGETIETVAFPRLRRVVKRACLLNRNLCSEEPVLYRSEIVKPPMFKRSGLPLDATGACVQIFDGRWILYRRPDHICVRHVYAKTSKETFDVKILSYARYEFKLGQIDKNVALIGVRHDIRETWSVMEMTLGDHPGVKPSMKLVPLEEVGFLEFVGGPRLVIYSQGALRLVDVHTLNRVTIANVVAENQRFVFHDRSLFSVFSRPGGLLQLSAYGIWEEADGLKRSTETRLILSLKEACVSYPPDKFFTETNIRSSSTDGIITIWHRVHMKVGDDVFYATFIIEVPYIRLGESHDERVYLGKNWTVRSTYIANGTHVIGNKAQSSLLSRFRAGDALLTAYPRLNIPRSHFRTKIVNRGISLPVPDGESCNGSDVHSIRTAWDDVHGIAVLYFNSGLIWILHYA